MHDSSSRAGCAAEENTRISQETQKRDEDKMIHLLDEDSMSSWVEFWSKESDDEVEK